MTNRRDFLKAAGAAALALASTEAGAAGGTEAAERPVLSLGLASYTFREFDLEAVIAMARRLGLEKICLKNMHLPLDAPAERLRDLAGRVRGAGLDLYACGVVYMNTAGEVETAFRYAQTAGVRLIVGVPAPLLLPLVDRLVRETGVALAIHNHGPGDEVYPTPRSAYERIRTLSPGLGLCLDVGHTARAGLDPAVEAEACADRLLDIHLKDVTAASAAGEAVEVGRGVIDIAALLRVLARIGYRGVAAFEYEKDGKDPLPGLAESVGYIRGLLEDLGGRRGHRGKDLSPAAPRSRPPGS